MMLWILGFNTLAFAGIAFFTSSIIQVDYETEEEEGTLVFLPGLAGFLAALNGAHFFIYAGL